MMRHLLSAQRMVAFCRACAEEMRGIRMKRAKTLALVGIVMQILAVIIFGWFHIRAGIDNWMTFVNVSVCVALLLMIVGWVLIASFFLVSTKEEKSASCFTIWIRHIKDFVFCFSYPFVVILCGWEFCRYFILDWVVKNKDALSGMEGEKIISATAWPVLILAIVFLFRKQLLLSLSQIPGLIKRSRYDNRNVTQNITKITSGAGKGGLSDEIVHGENQAPLTNDKSKDASPMNLGLEFENAVLKALEEEFWPYRLKRNACINESSFRFDAAVERNGWMYGIELKCARSVETFRRLIYQAINRLDGIYAEFPACTKERFIFLLCINLGDSDNKIPSEVTQIFMEKPYRIEIRLCDKNGQKKDSRRL